MSDIEWAEPPTENRGRRRDSGLAAIAETLRSRPGEWAKIGTERSASRAGNIRNGNLAAFMPSRSFEATSVKIGEGQFDIYARYVGEQ